MGAESSTFEGRWLLESGENYNDYLVDLGVPEQMREVYQASPPYLEIEVREGVHVRVRSWKKGTQPKTMAFSIGEPFLYSAHGFEELKTASVEGGIFHVKATCDVISPRWANMASVEVGHLVQTYVSLRSGVTCRRVFRPVGEEEWATLMSAN